MKNVLLLTVVLLLGATVAFAQAGSIGIYNDPAGASCNLTAPVGVRYFYFLHVNATDVTSSSWAAPIPTCLPATYLGYRLPGSKWVYWGNIETGVQIVYGEASEVCRTGTFLIMSGLYSVTGPAADCCRWRILPPIGPMWDGQIDGTDCDFMMIHPSGGEAIINPTTNCSCDVIVPAEDTTWGRVKALFSE